LLEKINLWNEALENKNEALENKNNNYGNNG
jgi:hypothetical protein